MTSPKAMREQAKELVLAAKARLDKTELTQAEQVQISVITDQVNAFTLVTMADMLEAMTPHSRLARAKQIMEQNDAIRAAAAKGFESGDWSDLDRIAGDSSSDQREGGD